MARILVIDDDRRLLDIYAEEFGEDHEVVTSNSARDAIGRLPAIRPDLVILDIRMPDMNGVDALGRILERDRKVPVILNSSISHDRRNFMTWAAEDYIVKSSDLTPLRGAIERALAGRGASVRPVVSA